MPNFIEGAMRNALSIQADPTRALSNAQTAFASSGNLALKLTALIDAEEKQRQDALIQQQTLDLQGKQLDETVRYHNILDTNADLDRGESIRHNKATEKVSAGNLSVRKDELKLKKKNNLSQYVNNQIDIINKKYEGQMLIDQDGNPTELGLKRQKELKEVEDLNLRSIDYASGGALKLPTSENKQKAVDKTISTVVQEEKNKGTDVSTSSLTVDTNKQQEDTGSTQLNLGAIVQDSTGFNSDQNLPGTPREPQPTYKKKKDWIPNPNKQTWEMRKTNPEESAAITILTREGVDPKSIKDISRATNILLQRIAVKPRQMYDEYSDVINKVPTLKRMTQKALVHNAMIGADSNDATRVSDAVDGILDAVRSNVMSTNEAIKILQTKETYRKADGSLPDNFKQSAARKYITVLTTRKDALDKGHTVEYREKIKENFSKLNEEDQYNVLNAINHSNVFGYTSGFSMEAYSNILNSAVDADINRRQNTGDNKFMDGLKDVQKITTGGGIMNKQLDSDKLSTSIQALAPKFKGFAADKKAIRILDLLSKKAELIGGANFKPGEALTNMGEVGGSAEARLYKQVNQELINMGVDPDKVSFSKVAASMFKGASAKEFMNNMALKTYTEMNEHEKNIYALVTYIETVNQLGDSAHSSRATEVGEKISGGVELVKSFMGGL